MYCRSCGKQLADQAVMFRNILPVTLGNLIGGLLILFLHPNRIRQLRYLLQQPNPAAEGGSK